MVEARSASAGSGLTSRRAMKHRLRLSGRALDILCVSASAEGKVVTTLPILLPLIAFGSRPFSGAGYRTVRRQPTDSLIVTASATRSAEWAASSIFPFWTAALSMNASRLLQVASGR